MAFIAELKRRNVIRVAVAYLVLSWLLLQVGDVLFQTLELPALWGKGLLALVALGFLPALIFSWVYELTPEGIKRESEVFREDSTTAHTAKKLDLAVLVMLAGVLVVFILDAPEAPGVAEVEGVLTNVTEIDSIAVLAFEDFSEGGEQAHLAVGLADAVLHILAQIPDLRVSARTSSFSFRGTAQMSL